MDGAMVIRVSLLLLLPWLRVGFYQVSERRLCDVYYCTYILCRKWERCHLVHLFRTFSCKFYGDISAARRTDFLIRNSLENFWALVFYEFEKILSLRRPQRYEIIYFNRLVLFAGSVLIHLTHQVAPRGRLWWKNIGIGDLLPVALCGDTAMAQFQTNLQVHTSHSKIHVPNHTRTSTRSWEFALVTSSPTWQRCFFIVDWCVYLLWAINTQQGKTARATRVQHIEMSTIWRFIRSHWKYTSERTHSQWSTLHPSARAI